MLDDAISAIADVLRSVSSNAGAVDPIQVMEDPPAALPGVRSFLLFEAPGDSIPAEHHGRGGGLVYQNNDAVAIEYHRKIQRDAPSIGAQETRVLLDVTRDALWSAFQRNRFAGTILGISGISTDSYGPDSYGSDVSFGFRLVLNISHRGETSSGKAL